MALETTVDHVDGRVAITVITLDGELDASNFESLVDTVRGLYEDGTRQLLLDLSGLRFMASSGLVALHSIVRIMHGEPALDPEAGWGALHAVGADDASADGGPAVRAAARRRARPRADRARPAVPRPSRSGDRASPRSEPRMPDRPSTAGPGVDAVLAPFRALGSTLVVVVEDATGTQARRDVGCGRTGWLHRAGHRRGPVGGRPGRGLGTVGHDAAGRRRRRLAGGRPRDRPHDRRARDRGSRRQPGGSSRSWPTAVASSAASCRSSRRTCRATSWPATTRRLARSAATSSTSSGCAAAGAR